MPSVQLPGLRLAYRSRGRGRPLLLLHGFLFDHSIWQPQLDGLAAAAHIIAPDLRGHGQSSAPPGAYPMTQLAEDCAALLDALGVTEPIVIGGHSMGGYVAFAFWRRYPARVAGLILLATRDTADSPARLAERERMLALARQGNTRAIVAERLPKMLAPPAYHEQPELAAAVERLLLNTPANGVIGALQCMRDRPADTPDLPAIAVPALVIHGLQDQMIPVPIAEAMHRAIPRSRQCLLPAAGHLPSLEQPGRVNQAITSFLQDVHNWAD